MTTAANTYGEARERLMGLAEHPDPYLFLNCVGDYLRALPLDDQVRATAMRLAVHLRLFSVAEEFALACPPSSSSHGALQALAEQFAVRRTDCIEVSTTDACLAKNLQVLAGRGESGARIAEQVEVAAGEMPPELTLLQAGDGNLLARAARRDGQRIWLPAAQDFRGKTEAIAEEVSFRGDFVAPFLVDGVGAGWLVPRLYAATQNTYLSYSPAIYVIEPNLRALALVLRLHDWSEALADERLLLAAGASAWADWMELMRSREDLAEPRQTISLARWPGDAATPAADCLRQVGEQRQCALHALRSATDALYAGRDAAWWAQRYATSGDAEPLRVLCVTSRHTTFLQHSMRDLQTALDRAGVQTRLLIEASDYTVMSGLVTLRAIQAFKPDLVVVIDHHRYEMAERIVADVPFVCWIQDHMPRLFSEDAGRSLGPLDFTIGFGKESCVKQFGYAPERFMSCWLAVNPEKFAPAQVASGPEDSAALSCDVVYVGHQAETPEALHARIRAQIAPPVTQLVDAFFEEMLPRMRAEGFNGAHHLEALLQEMEQRTRIGLTDEESRARLLGVYVRPLVDKVLRHTTLEWVADWAEGTGRTLHLYGRDWEGHPRFGRFARGEARHGAHLGAIARAAAINLHCGLNVSLHQRVLETAIAGGFLLVRYHPQDFYPAWLAQMHDYVRTHQICPPARIAYGDLPFELTEAHRRRMEEIGRRNAGEVEIFPGFLESHDPAGAHERRYQFAGEMFPMLADMIFDSASSFAAQAERYLADAKLRQDTAARMQAVVQCEFTYDALVSKLLGFVGEELATDARGRG